MDFNIIDEYNHFKLGEIITIFKIDNSKKEYALFSINDYEEDNSSLQVGYLKKDSLGYDYVDIIEDEKELEKATKVAHDMLNKINKVKTK